MGLVDSAIVLTADVIKLIIIVVYGISCHHESHLTDQDHMSPVKSV